MIKDQVIAQLQQLLTSANLVPYYYKETISETTENILRDVYHFIDPKEQKPEIEGDYLVYRSGGLTQQPRFDILPWFGKYWGVSVYDDPTDEIVGYLAFPLNNLRPYAEKQELK